MRIVLIFLFALMVVVFVWDQLWNNGFYTNQLIYKMSEFLRSLEVFLNIRRTPFTPI